MYFRSHYDYFRNNAMYFYVEDFYDWINWISFDVSIVLFIM